MAAMTSTNTSTLPPVGHNSLIMTLSPQMQLKPAASVENNVIQDPEHIAPDPSLKTLAETGRATIGNISHPVTHEPHDDSKGNPDATEPDTIATLSPVPENGDDESIPSAGGSKDDPIDIDDSPATFMNELSRRPKGRSHGEKSNKHIKDLRTAATKGNIEAALKLGWSVERLTALYNRHKASRGIPATEDEPIDDPELLARIEQRKEHGREATKRRTDKLKARAAAGDLEAAKKLGLGKKTMEALFPNLVPGNFGARQMREKTPSQQQDAVHDNAAASNQPIADRVKAIVESRAHKANQSIKTDIHQHNGGAMPAYIPGAFHGHAQEVDAGGSWGNMRSWEQMYPMPPAQFQIEIQLQTAYDEAKRLAAIANQRAVDLGDKLKRYRECQEKFGVAMYEVMTRTVSKLSVRDQHGSGRGMGHPIAPWAMMSDGGKVEE